MRLKRLLLLHGGALGYRIFYFGTHLVCKLTDDGALIGRKSRHTAQNGGKLALLAEVADSQRFKIRVGGVYPFKRFRTDLLKNFFHFSVSFLSVYPFDYYFRFFGTVTA